MRQRPPSTRRGGKQLTCFRWVDDAVHFLHLYVNVLYVHIFRLIDAAACCNSMWLSGFQITCVFVNTCQLKLVTYAR